MAIEKINNLTQERAVVTIKARYTEINILTARGPKGSQGIQGPIGMSAYEVWLSQGHSGSKEDYLDSLIGPKGDKGEAGTKGDTGESAYEFWISEGNTGTIVDFLESLVGPQGLPGKDGEQGPEGPINTDAGSLTGTLPESTIPSRLSTTSLNNTYLIKSNNLSDIPNKATAKSNLGLANIASSGSATDLTSGTIDEARLPTRLGSTVMDSTYLRTNNNLSDINNSSLARSNIGLGNVNNTSDLNKPISTATQNALNDKFNITGGTISGNITANSVYFNSINIDRNGENKIIRFRQNDGVNTPTNKAAIFHNALNDELHLTLQNPSISAYLNRGSNFILPADPTDVKAATTKQYVDARVRNSLIKSNNLSDLTNKATARTNLGLGTAAVRAENYFQTALRYTPVNKAGDIMTGSLELPSITTSAAIGASFNNAENVTIIFGTANGTVKGQIVSGSDGALFFHTYSTPGGTAAQCSINPTGLFAAANGVIANGNIEANSAAGWGGAIRSYTGKSWGSSTNKCQLQMESGNAILTSSARGNKGIFTFTPRGGFSASGSKNFYIDHPLKLKNTKLIHAAIEAPEVMLQYRGIVQLLRGQAIVHIDEACKMTEGTFNVLTKNAYVSALNNLDGFERIRATEIINGSFTIYCEDVSFQGSVSWLVTASRNDPDIINIYDSEGNFIVEEYKLPIKMYDEQFGLENKEEELNEES